MASESKLVIKTSSLNEILWLGLFAKVLCEIWRDSFAESIDFVDSAQDVVTPLLAMLPSSSKLFDNRRLSFSGGGENMYEEVMFEPIALSKLSFISVSSLPSRSSIVVSLIGVDEVLDKRLKRLISLRTL